MFYDTLDLHTHLGKILPLVVEHGIEINGDASNIDLDSFLTLAKVDLLRIYTANDGEKIVGYTLYLLSRDIFQMHNSQADCVAIYVRPKFRGSSVARNLIRFSEMSLATDSKTAKVIMHSNGRPALKNFFHRMGYNTLDELVYKEIK